MRSGRWLEERHLLRRGGGGAFHPFLIRCGDASIVAFLIVERDGQDGVPGAVIAGDQQFCRDGRGAERNLSL